MANKSAHPRKRVKSKGSLYAETAALPWPVCAELSLTGCSTTLDASRVPNAALLRHLTPQPTSEASSGSELLLSALPDAPMETRGSLPAEFCTREFLNLDVDDEASILSFMARYGIVAAPYFGSHRAFACSCTPVEREPEWTQGEGDALKAHLERRWLDMLDECGYCATDGLDGFRGMLRDAAWASEAMRAEAVSFGEEKRFRSVVAWDEALLALALLRESIALMAALDIAAGDLGKAVVTMLEMGVAPRQMLGNRHWGDWSCMGAAEIMELGKPERAAMIEDIVLTLESQRAIPNACMFVNSMAYGTGAVAYTGFRAYLGAAAFEFSHGLFPGNAARLSVREAESALNIGSRDPSRQGSLGSALSLQLIGMLESDRPWERCAREGCPHYFKRYRRHDGTASSRRKRSALLCSQHCRQKQARATHSAAVKELNRRIDARIKGDSLIADDEWLDAMIDEINASRDYLSISDRSRLASTPVSAFSPRHPMLTPDDREKAKWRLVTRRKRQESAARSDAR